MPGRSLQLGAYSRRQLPPDIIEMVDGTEIVLSAPDASTQVGMTIDYGDGKLVLLP